MFYSHVNYSVTKIFQQAQLECYMFYSHVNYSVTKIDADILRNVHSFTVT